MEEEPLTPTVQTIVFDMTPVPTSSSPPVSTGEETEEKEMCCICLETKCNTTLRCCRNPIHSKCLRLCIKYKDTCPMCRHHWPHVKPIYHIPRWRFVAEENPSATLTVRSGISTRTITIPMTPTNAPATTVQMHEMPDFTGQRICFRVCSTLCGFICITTLFMAGILSYILR